MEISNLISRITLSVAVVALFFLTSCSGEDQFLTDDLSNIRSETLEDAYFEDVTDMGLAALDEEGFGGGRAGTDERFNECVTISVSPNSTVNEGSLILDFGESCVGPRGNVRSGVIHVAWSNGSAGAFGFTVVYTFDGYSINEVKLEGICTIIRIAPKLGENNIRHSINLDDGKATWPDGTFTTRTSFLEREWVTDPTDERIILEGDASGTNRKEKGYSVEIIQTIEYRRACMLVNGTHMPTTGVKVLRVDDRRMIIIDYGDGTCDREVSGRIGDSGFGYIISS